MSPSARQKRLRLQTQAICIWYIILGAARFPSLSCPANVMSIFLRRSHPSSSLGTCALLKFLCLLLGASALQYARAAEMPWSARMADSTIKRWPKGDFLPADKTWAWNYELGV